MNDRGSDKGSGWHNYTIFYQEIFKEKRLDELNIFEVGLGTNNTSIPSNMGPEGKPGASLKGWKEYFSNSNIYGADIDKDILFEEERIKTFYCDQLNPGSILNMWDSPDLRDKEFDVIIDDGLHEFEANINFFRNSIHKLKKGGIFIIEDIHQVCLKEFKNALPSLGTEFGYLSFELKEISNPENSSDNNLLIIKYKDENSNINISSIKTKKLIDCFTFYNEIEMLELRLTELYDVVDKFIIVESNLTHKGDNKKFYYEENSWKFKKWKDKIIHVKIEFPEHLDVWGREKYQRNSFMPSLYSLGLSNDDIVVISDLDEIPDSNTLSYIKTSYPMKGLFKLEMDHYWASIYNKLIYPEKWYHAKIVDWETLKGRTPDDCRLDFNCQWWERGGWHLSYFGGPDLIVNKINSTAHQELNQERFKIKDEVIRKVKEGLDLFDEWRRFQKVDPLENPYLPKNWKVLLPNEEKYGNKIRVKKNLVIGTAINIGIDETKTFIKSLRKYSDSDICLLVNSNIDQKFSDFLEENNVRTIRNSISSLYQPNINVTRFFQYYDFLLENKEEYQNILITDVTDVFFQSDPFLDLSGEFIYFAEEDEDHTIGSNSFNSRWIQISKGDEYLEKLSDRKIICAGTTIGSYKNVLEYLAQMILIIREVKDHNPSALNEGVDQGIHNFICYEKIDLFKNPEIKKNGDLIATMGLTSLNNPERIFMDEKNIIVNGKNPKIVHQYNRSKEITEFVHLLVN